MSRIQGFSVDPQQFGQQADCRLAARWTLVNISDSFGNRFGVGAATVKMAPAALGLG